MRNFTDDLFIERKEREWMHIIDHPSHSHLPCVLLNNIDLNMFHPICILSIIQSQILFRIKAGSAYRQFGFMLKMEVRICHNSQKVTAASV